MAENLLILSPKDFDALPSDKGLLIAALREEQFIGEGIELNGEQHYRPGEEFMMLITFMGCSPMIYSGEDAEDGEQYCHIDIEGPYDKPHAITGDNIKIPRCPKCGHRFDNWRELLESWSEAPHDEFSCPACGEHQLLTTLRWRKCVGFGRLFIKVWGIFESEAVPSPNLMAALKRATGLEWQHFYIRNN